MGRWALLSSHAPEAATVWKEGANSVQATRWRPEHHYETRTSRRQTETHRGTQRHTEAHRDTQRHTDTHRQTQTDTDTETHTETHRDTQRHTEKHRDTQRHTETNRKHDVAAENTEQEMAS